MKHQFSETVSIKSRLFFNFFDINRYGDNSTTRKACGNADAVVKNVSQKAIEML